MYREHLGFLWGVSRRAPTTVIFTAIFIVWTCALLLQVFVPARAADPLLVVAYVDGNTLYVWHEGAQPQSIATGNITRPILSPNAAQVIYQSDGALWIADASGKTAPRSLVMPEALNPDKSHSVLDMAWLNDSVIIFNTYRFSPKTLIQQQFADDLWRVDGTSGKVEMLRDKGQGGAFSINPTGKSITLVRPGDYPSQAPGTITLVDANGQNPVKILEFPYVNTGASYQFYAQMQWSAAGGVLFVAIPPPNLVYTTENVPPTVLWQIGLDGKAVQLGQVSADFFGLPTFSSDGKAVLYARRIGPVQNNQIALYRANSDGSGEQEIARDMIGVLEPARWTPDGSSYTFVHGKPGEVWIAGKQGPQRFPNPQESVYGLIWADASTYIYTTTLGGANDLRYGIAGSLSPTTIAHRATGGDFDAQRITSTATAPQ